MISRIVRLTFISLIILFIVVTGVSLLFPSTVIVSRAVNINASPDSITTHINNIFKWKDWVEGMNAPTVHIFSETEADLNQTKVVIDSLGKDVVHSFWQNKKGKWMTSAIHLYHDSSHPETVVQWQFEQKLKWYPWEKFASLLNDKILGTMMEKNLDNLKKLMEKN